MNREVFVDGLFLRSVVPMMVSGHDQELFDPFGIGAEITMRPGGVKGDKDQIPQDDGLRKSEHEGSKNKSAHKRVVHKVGARARNPIQRLRRMMNGMKAPQKRHFVQSQMNEIFSDVRNHDGQEKLKDPRHARDKVMKRRDAQIFGGLGGGQQNEKR